MKLVIVNSGIPDRQNGASLVLYWWYICSLKDSGLDILNILVLGENSHQESVRKYQESLGDVERFKVVTVSSKKQIIVDRVRGPIKVCPQVSEAVMVAINNFQPDMVLSFDLLSAWCVKSCKKKPHIVWLGDLNFQTAWYHGLYAIKSGNIYGGLLSLIRGLQWRQIYANTLKNVTKLIVASESSVNQLSKFGLDAEFLPYPWPAKPFQERKLPPELSLIFFGTLDALGSKASYRTLFKEIYPLLKRKIGAGKFKIKICGRGELPSTIRHYLEHIKEFEWHGFVPDLEVFMAKSHALIAPIEVPVGNRSRILTALSQKLPVIAHVHASRGNPMLVTGENCFLADNASQMVDAIMQVYQQPLLATKIAEAGFETYQNNYSPSSACRKFNFILNSVV